MLTTVPSAETLSWTRVLIARPVPQTMPLKNVTLLGVSATTLSTSTAFQDGYRPKLPALSTTRSGNGDRTECESFEKGSFCNGMFTLNNLLINVINQMK